MSTTSETTTLPATPPADDPFRYGWRYVRHQHPHELICTYLAEVFRARLGADATVLVARDLRIAWDAPELEPHGPDVMVIFGVRERKRWRTFRVAEEQTRPALIIEVTSPSTRSLDLAEKRDEYDEAGVPLYVIVDVTERRGQVLIRLLGYEQRAGSYQVLPPDEQGRLWLEPVGLWLGVEGDRVYCYNESGVRLGDYTTVSAALAAAEARASVAEERAQAEAEARALADARVTAEAEARVQAEARLQALEAELQRLRGEG